MRLWPILKRKAAWEIDRVAGLLLFPRAQKRIESTLASALTGLQVETTNICNADCIFCAYQYQERPTGVMSVELFQKLVDEYAELGGGAIGLTPTVGDPLVDKHLLQRIHYARANARITGIGMYSNMISLDRVGADALARSGLTSLTVSISGLDEGMYKRVYRSDMYRQVYRNLKLFVAANKAAGSPVDFQIDMRADRPVSEILNYPDYREMASLIGAEKIGVKFRYDDWSGRITPEQLSGNMKIRTLLPPRVSACSELYSGVMVYWDGRVGACGCRDVNAQELIIGDANRQHLGEIWFGPEIRKLREEFLTPKIRPICSSCKHYNSLAVWSKPSNRERLHQIQPSSWHAARETAIVNSPGSPAPV